MTMNSDNFHSNAICTTLLVALLFFFTPPSAQGRTVATPWSEQTGVQNLVVGSSTMGDVQRALGEAPSEILRSEQMYPVLENAYYYDESGNGAATVFVFENGMLVGMFYRSPDNQFADLTYFLTNNGDRLRNWPMLAGYRGYYPYFPMYGFY